MSIILVVEPKSPYAVPMPSGSYVRPGLAIADIALALTKHKLAVEARGEKESVAHRATLKGVRDIANYETDDDGWVYEDDNILVMMSRRPEYEPRLKPQIWLDSDGVAAHFDKQVENITGRTIADLGDERMWELCGPRQDFWDTMPIMPGFERLWAALKPLNPIILTGCPKTAYDLAAERKRIWWKKHFNHDEVFTCLSKDKAQFIELPNDVLIDDFYVNIKRFRAAGGIGIWHKSVDETLDQLSQMGLVS